PAPIILAARDEGLVKMMMSSKIEQMIDSTGIRKKIRSSSIKARNSSTGDTALEKQFSGGTLRAFSIQQPSRMRQISAKYGFLDDFEAAKTDKDAGDAASLFETRFTSYGPQAKIFYISTPEVKQKSNIEPLYDRGDKRKWHVPCPCCGDYITLEWKTKGKDGKKAGITWELDSEDKLIKESVGYTCQSCGGFFKDNIKHELNLAGEWKPTARAEDETFRSYHLSSLYAPAGMSDWADCVQKFLVACPPNKPTKIPEYKTFINTILGWPFEERGREMKANALSLNTREYPIGVVPDQLSIDEGNGPICMVTMACDLGGKNDDARVDYEIVAWSQGGQSYSIDHGSIGTFVNSSKDNEDIPRDKMTYDHFRHNSVWGQLQEIMEKSIPSDNGKDFFNIQVTGIDTGHFTQNAYTFIDQCIALGLNVLGLKGRGIDQTRKLEANTKIYTRGKENDLLYLLEVNQIKDELASNMDQKWNEDKDILQPNGLMNFPTPSEGKYTMKSYFKHYEGEKKVMKMDAFGKPIGFVWEKKSAASANHFFDCRIYNLAIKEIASDKVCSDIGLEIHNWHNYCQYMTS
ncbi:MAG: phage terminase large subunit family protein, partial [Psychroserpens sp.]|nr:phage terminase large subunit family protein [Psychroserpens sp.]